MIFFPPSPPAPSSFIDANLIESRRLFARRLAAWMGWCGWQNDCVRSMQNRKYFGYDMHNGWCASCQPHGQKKDTGHVGRGLGKVSGVFLPGVTAPFLAKDAFGHNDGNHPIVHKFFGWLWHFFCPRERETHNFGFIVAQASDTPVWLRRQSWELATWSLHILCHGGRFGSWWHWAKLAREGGLFLSSYCADFLVYFCR